MTIVLQLAGYLLIAYFIGPLGNEFVRAVLRVSGVPSTPPQTPPPPNVASAPVFPAATSMQSPPTNPPLPPAAPGSSESAEKTIKAGRWIGPLERLLLVIGMLASSWDIITAVVALKTVARYKELDTQMTAEYFLIGSLASILWALAMAWTAYAYDGALGFHFLPHALSASDDTPLLHYIRASTGI